MSGPPHWLAYAWVVSLWVAAGCVGMAVLSALLDRWPPARAPGLSDGRSRPPKPPINFL